MKNSLIIFMLLNILILIGFSNNNDYLKLKIDGIEKKFKVENALFYKDATIKFDTTVQVSTEDSFENYYYPQIVAGDNNIIRMILKKSEQTYDLLIEFNADASDKIELNDNNAKAIINSGFKLQSSNQFAENIKGKVELIGLSDNAIRKAIIDLNFSRMVGDKSDLVAVKGSFVPVYADLNSESVFSEIIRAKGENEYIRHLELAGIIVSIFLIMFLTK